MDIVPYAGWERCARFKVGDVEALVILDVGPRIIRLGFENEVNMLHENIDQTGVVGGDDYRSYGGHRLWVAPEDLVRTYEPDNGPVEVAEAGDGWTSFSSTPGASGLRKTIRVRADADAGVFQLDHVIRNESAVATTLAPWALTVLANGGECIFPMPPQKMHSEALLPAAPLVLWHYTRLNDPRWTWGETTSRLRQVWDMGPQKVGMFVSQGWAAYANHGNLFIKRFPAEQDKTYPDFGCNFETFTRQDMLEIESLGTLVDLEPGHEVHHPEEWRLLRGTDLPLDVEGFEALLPGAF